MSALTPAAECAGADVVGRRRGELRRRPGARLGVVGDDGRLELVLQPARPLGGDLLPQGQPWWQSCSPGTDWPINADRNFSKPFSGRLKSESRDRFAL